MKPRFNATEVLLNLGEGRGEPVVELRAPRQDLFGPDGLGDRLAAALAVRAENRRARPAAVYFAEGLHAVRPSNFTLRMVSGRADGQACAPWNATRPRRGGRVRR